MYLSRVRLNMRRGNTMKALASPAILHGAVEAAFAGERRRRLWRLDQLGGEQYLLIVSEDKPNLQGMTEQLGYAGEYKTLDYTPLFNKIANQSKWRFRLTANPTIAKKQTEGRGRVVAIISQEQQIEWLLHKGERHGFAVAAEDFQVVGKQWYRFLKKDDNGRQLTVTLYAVTYEGVLTVTDAEKFVEALSAGIGREKAYGMGMLTVMRV